MDKNKCIVVGDDFKIYLFDLGKMEFVYDTLFEGHLDLITDLAFNSSKN